MFLNHQFNVERVRQFEQEMEGRLQELTKVEKDILLVGQQRAEWLNNITVTEKSETVVYTKRFEILKAQAELSSLQMTADILNLESHYEAQSLNYLVEATKPVDTFGNAAENLQSREVELLNLSRKDNQKLAGCLMQSIDFRCKLGNLNYDLGSEINKMKVAIAAEHQMKIDETKEKLMTYLDRLDVSLTRSKAIHKKTTSEYLVLRHNARVAKEILLRSQNEAHLLREQLQKRLESMSAEAEVQHQRIEESSKQEIKVLTRDLRAAVMEKEAEYEATYARVKRLSKEKADDFKHVRSEIKRYDKKYNDLQRSRKKDIRTVTAELQRLRNLISEAEQKLSLSEYAERGVGGLNYGDVGGVIELENFLTNLQLDPSRNSAGAKLDSDNIVKKLKDKLRELDMVTSRSADHAPERRRKVTVIQQKKKVTPPGSRVLTRKVSVK